MQPDVAGSWNELDGVWSVEGTGEPMGWRSVERSESVWQLRSADAELLVSRGNAGETGTDWWLSMIRDGQPVVDGHRIRIGDDAELGEALAAVLTALR